MIRPIGWRLAAVCVLCAAPVLATECQTQQAPLVIGTELDYPPYSFLDENGEAAGYNVDLTRAIARVMDLDIEVRIGPWAEIRQALESGQIDVISGMHHSAERDRLVGFSPRFTVVHHAIFVRRGTPAIETEEDLRGKDIIVMRGDIMHDYVLVNGLSDRPVLVGTPSGALRLLASGEHDCALIAQLPGLYWSENLGLSNIVTVGPLLRPSDYCYAVTRSSTALLARLAEGLAILGKTGAHKQIYDKWLGVLEPRGVSLVTVVEYVTLAVAPLLLALAAFVIWSRTLKRQVAQRTNDLRESEERYRAIAEDTPVLICRFLPGGKITYVNDAYCKYFESAPEELVGQSFLSLIPEADRETVMANISALTVDSPTQSHEHQVIAPDGEVRWQRWTNRALFDDKHKAVAYQSVGEDVTERKLAEQALHESELRLRQMADTIGDVFWVTDWDSKRTVFASKSYERIWGRTRKSLYDDRKGWADAIHPEDRDHAWESFVRLAEGETYEAEYRIIRPDGEVRWIRDRGYPVRGEPGGVTRVVGVAQDITGRKRAEEEQERLTSAIEQAAETVVITGADGTIQYVNPAFERITGYTHDEAVGQNPRLLKSGKHDDAFYQDMWHTLLRGDTWSGRLVNKKRDGTLFTEEATISPVRDASGRTVNYVAVKRDITDELKLEEQLHQSQKMEAIGRLAGGVAHDFNNQLQAIMMNCDLALGEVRETDPVAESVAEIREAAERSARLTRQLLAFSRRQALAPEVLDPNQLVQNLESMLQRIVGEDVDLRTVLAPGCGCVQADPGQLEHVIVNLVVNARDAMPRGGRLTLEVAEVELDETYARDHVNVTPGSYVMTAVSDTGCGMDEETQRQVFEPFFTTKEHGSGLGLATVHGVVRQSDGHVFCYSEPGEGTTFKVYLPRADEAPEKKPARATPQTTRGSETILVAEDEQTLRLSMSKVLEREGYTVFTAAYGDEALLLCRRHPGRFDLLVTDLVMPGMSGKELADELTRLQPGLKALFMSGYTDNAIVHHGRLDEGTPFLQKPFDAGSLAVKIREVLDDEGS